MQNSLLQSLWKLVTQGLGDDDLGGGVRGGVWALWEQGPQAWYNLTGSYHSARLAQGVVPPTRPYL